MKLEQLNVEVGRLSFALVVMSKTTHKLWLYTSTATPPR